MNIPKIKPEHLRRMESGLRETVSGRIEELRNARDPYSMQAKRFFAFLLDDVDETQFDEIRSRFLADPSDANNVGALKYLDPVTWFESKLRTAMRLELHTSPPLRILDLGTGPGHFPVVARFLGHEVVGTDLKQIVHSKPGNIYNALCEVYKVHRVVAAIKPFEVLDSVEGPYDLVTAFLAAFNVDQNKKPWTTEQWEFFLTHLTVNVAKPSGRLFMSLANDKLTEESWIYLRERADWNDETAKRVYFSKLATSNS